MILLMSRGLCLRQNRERKLRKIGLVKCLKGIMKRKETGIQNEHPFC